MLLVEKLKKLKWEKIAIATLLGYLYFLISVTPLSSKHAVFDEGYHLTRGIALLETGDFRINIHHPYLGNIYIALPAVFVEDNRDFILGTQAWETSNKDWLTYELVEKSGGTLNYSLTQLYYPRVAQILLTSIFIATYYLLISNRFSQKAGVISALFLLLSPSILAHGSIATNDMQVTILIFLTTYSLYLHVDRKDILVRKYLYIFILLAFLSILTKYSALMCLPIWLSILTYDYFRRGRRPIIRVAGILLLWLVLLIFAYKAEFKTLSDVSDPFYSDRDVTQLYLFQQALRNIVPLPMPYYIQGFIENVISKSINKHETFMLGSYSDIGGEYFILSILTKETLLFNISFLAGVIFYAYTYLKKYIKLREFPNISLGTLLLATIPLFILTLAMLSSIRLGIRHILPLIPFMTLFIGVFYEKVSNFKSAQKYTYTIFCFGILATVVSLLYQYPNFIGYYNESIGSHKNGHLVFHDSNLDWNQNEILVQKYIAENSDKNITYINTPQQIVQPGRYYVVKLVYLFGDPLYQYPNYAALREMYNNGEFKEEEWIENSHWLIYIEE